MSDQPQSPVVEQDDPDLFPDDFEGFMENPDAPEPNSTPVVEGVADVSQDPNWIPKEQQP